MLTFHSENIAQCTGHSSVSGHAEGHGAGRVSIYSFRPGDGPCDGIALAHYNRAEAIQLAHAILSAAITLEA